MATPLLFEVIRWPIHLEPRGAPHASDSWAQTARSRVLTFWHCCLRHDRHRAGPGTVKCNDGFDPETPATYVRLGDDMVAKTVEVVDAYCIVT